MITMEFGTIEEIADFLRDARESENKGK